MSNSLYKIVFYSVSAAIYSTLRPAKVQLHLVTHLLHSYSTGMGKTKNVQGSQGLQPRRKRNPFCEPIFPLAAALPEECLYLVRGPLSVFLQSWSLSAACTQKKTLCNLWEYKQESQKFCKRGSSTVKYKMLHIIRSSKLLV